MNYKEMLEVLKKVVVEIAAVGDNDPFTLELLKNTVSLLPQASFVGLDWRACEDVDPETYNAKVIVRLTLTGPLGEDLTIERFNVVEFYAIMNHVDFEYVVADGRRSNPVIDYLCQFDVIDPDGDQVDIVDYASHEEIDVCVDFFLCSEKMIVLNRHAAWYELDDRLEAIPLIVRSNE